MGLRFRKSITIAKGVKLNIGKSGLGVSVGPRGLKYSANTSGRKGISVGIPGTGLSYTKQLSGKKSHNRQNSSSQNSSNSTASSTEIEEVLEYETYLLEIQSVHKHAMDEIDWNHPMMQEGIGKREMQAQAAYEAYQPKGFLSNFMGDKRQSELKAAILEARKEDEEERQIRSSLAPLSQKVLEGDIDAYYTVLEKLNLFEDLVDYGSGFEFGTEDPRTMEVEFQVMSQDIVPNTSKSLTKTGKLLEKALSKSRYYEITQDYVCSACIRLARDVFAILPVDSVLVHAVDSGLDTKTGQDREYTILSVRFERSGFININFDRIDPSDFLESFEHNERFLKMTGFREVERLQ